MVFTKRTPILGWGIAALLVAGLLGSPAQSAPSAPSPSSSASDSKKVPTTADGSQVFSETPCQRVVYIGARGSDQKLDQASGLGAEVYGGWQQYSLKLPETTSKGFYVVDYPALAADPRRLSSEKYRNDFAASLDLGVIDTMRFLKSRFATCPNEHYVLAGFSQGAMVVRRVLFVLLEQQPNVWDLPTSVLSRVDGVLLIGNGDRLGADDGVSQSGTATQTKDSWGISYEDLWRESRFNYPPSARRVPQNVNRESVWEVCMRGDLVCDAPGAYGNGPQKGSWGESMSIHGNSYQRWGKGSHASDGLIFVQAAATNIARLTREWIIDPQITTTTLGEVTRRGSYEIRLRTADNRNGRWSITAGALPSGIELDPDHGVISGSTSEPPGSYPVTVRFVDGNALTATQTMSLEVVPLAIRSEELPVATPESTYGYRLTTSEPRPGSWALLSGRLPAGLTLDSATGEIGGWVTAEAVTESFVVGFTDTWGERIQQAMTLTVGSQSLSIVTTSLPWQYDYVPYSAQLRLNDDRPGTWTITDGYAASKYLVLDPETGILTGFGAGTFEVSFTDVDGNTARRTLTLNRTSVGLEYGCTSDSKTPEIKDKLILAYGVWTSDAPPIEGKFVVNGVEYPWGSGTSTTVRGWTRELVLAMEPGQTYNAEIWAQGHRIALLTDVYASTPWDQDACRRVPVGADWPFGAQLG